MRFLQPGQVVSVMGSGDGARYAVVLRTSRHKREYSEAQAQYDLACIYAEEGDILDMTAVVAWWRHTKKVLDFGCSGPDCEQGSWCSGGDGESWAHVMYGTPLPESETTHQRRRR